MGLIRNLKDTEPFNHLPEELFAEFDREAVSRKFPPHTYIFKQHEPPTGYLYIIKEGLVEIVALTPGGVEMVVDYRKEGSFLGGTPIFTGESYTASARTVNETECYLIPEKLLTRSAVLYPQLTEYFTKAIFSRVRNLYAEMVSDHTNSTLSQVEAYPFKKRLSEIMSTPVETCPLTTPVRKVAQKMAQKGIGAIIVSENGNNAAGIITERDLVTKVLAREIIDCQDASAADIMTRNPFTMPPETYMYEAAAFMMRHRIRHMPVLDRGEVVGIVTLQDLMRYRSQRSMLMVGSVREAQTIDDLAAVKKEMVFLAKSLMNETRSPLETMEILSYIHHCILRRAFEVTMEEMKAEGHTPPAIRFCHIIMGSGGRKEMLLGPDQDNGLIYENFPDERAEEVDAFFIPFSEKLVEAYDRIGYPLCNGKVMANNPLWRGRLKDWEKRVSNWIHTPEPLKVMYSTIFFDFMPLVGDPSLCQDLRDIVHRQIADFPLFLYHLMALDFQHKVPLGLFGRFSLEKEGEHKGELSIKRTGSVFIVDCIRMFLLEKQIHEITTIDRLERLVKLNVFNQETAEHIKAAFEAFTFLRLRQEISLAERGETPSHYIAPYALPKNEQDLLKEAFRAAGKLQDSAKRHFNVG